MTDAAPHPIPVFVYGSLRPGLYNFPMAERALAADPLPAVVHGFELYANKSDSYPYLAVGEGDVKGDVLMIYPGRELDSIIGMEEGAGYDTRAIKADITFPDGKVETFDVMAFVHREDRRSHRGTKVEDGDWLPYYAEAERRFHAANPRLRSVWQF
ncbi:hypothetical protein SEA_OTTAWA_64 [Arthrobacter phage Ottawa]|nr:hypothetical protein SEA_OTTAWA_64 [Arthrobacter phage Ottawa]